MRRPTLPIALVTAAIGLIAVGPAAGATAPEVQRALAARIVIDTVAIPGPNDPGRCVGESFVAWNRVAGAVRYEVTATPPPSSAAVGVRPISRTVPETGGAPPLPTTFSWYPAVFSWPASEIRIPLSGASTGAGCGEAGGAPVHAWTVSRAIAVVKARYVPPRQRRTSLPGARDGTRQRTHVAIPRGRDFSISWTGPAPTVSVDGERLRVDGRSTHNFDPRDWERMTIVTGPDTRLRISGSGRNAVTLKVGPKTTVSVGNSPIRSESQPYFSNSQYLPPYLTTP